MRTTIYVLAALIGFAFIGAAHADKGFSGAGVGVSVGKGVSVGVGAGKFGGKKGGFRGAGVGVSIGKKGHKGNGYNGNGPEPTPTPVPSGPTPGARPVYDCWPWEMVTWGICEGEIARDRLVRKPVKMDRTAVKTGQEAVTPLPPPFDPRDVLTKGDLASALAPLERDVEALRRQIDGLINQTLKGKK